MVGVRAPVPPDAVPSTKAIFGCQRARATRPVSVPTVGQCARRPAQTIAAPQLPPRSQLAGPIRVVRTPSRHSSRCTDVAQSPCSMLTNTRRAQREYGSVRHPCSREHGRWLRGVLRRPRSEIGLWANHADNACCLSIFRENARVGVTVCVFAIGTDLTGIPLHRVVSEAAPTSHRLIVRPRLARTRAALKNSQTRRQENQWRSVRGSPHM
jgi:hypothetical protein